MHKNENLHRGALRSAELKYTENLKSIFNRAAILDDSKWPLQKTSFGGYWPEKVKRLPKNT